LAGTDRFACKELEDMSVGGSFFDESRDQSKVKSTIVAKYFDAWARVIVSTQKRYPHKSQNIAYIDLFAGRGRYEDGTQSTPLLVLEKAIKNPDIRDRLIAIFNDKDENNSQSLKEAVNALPGIRTLAHPPVVYSHEVGQEIVKMFERMKLVPTLFFVDPWGYKGLSLRLAGC
jgi:three-Cys-motif partner protein